MNEKVLILRNILKNEYITQRELSDRLSLSLGKINKLISELIKDSMLLKKEGKLNGRKAISYHLTKKAYLFLEDFKVDRAIILAAGFGSRFVPLTFETPKGLLEVKGERMIERQIKQLHEAGIYEILIMVGYLKESFDYLIDKYNVKLMYNPEYSSKNTLATMHYAGEFLKGHNAYILSSDNWLRENMYHQYEPSAWYSAVYMEGDTEEWAIESQKSGKIIDVKIGGSNTYCMYGPVYFSKKFSESFIPIIDAYYKMPGTDQMYWEDVYIRNIKILPDMYINKQVENQVYEFENLEELRLFDEKYKKISGSKAMELVSSVFEIPESDIVGIKCLKSGMTNRSWLFRLDPSSSAIEKFSADSFICRIPGAGTDRLINRKNEARVYNAIKDLSITEELIYINEENGYKISKYYKGAVNADFSDSMELKKCLSYMKYLHNSDIKLSHDFDIELELEKYEKLLLDTDRGILFKDYWSIKEKAKEVINYLKSLNRPKTIAHVDSVADNFIFTEDGLKMIDWEYSGMADPLIDLSMALIYSFMPFEDVKGMLDKYILVESYGGKVPAGDGGISLNGGYDEALNVIIAYMGLGGLLWALWGLYKSTVGEEFGDYTLKMYRYFKDSYEILQNRMNN